jgi:predicted phage baseplate assembly protein
LLRFGDGQYGLPPPDEQVSNPALSAIEVNYRVGVGTVGNVGSDSLVHVTKNDNPPPGTPNVSPTLALIVGARNPLAAWGGLDPEPIELVKQLAPAAFRAEQFRAVTEADYARAAEKHPEVSKAVATFRWTGSWYTVFITIDPLGRTDVPSELEQSVRAFVTRFTQAGYDLELDPPIFVPLEIEIDVCVAVNHFRGDVEQAVLRTLSNQVFPDGQRGFFHSDNFTFGQALFLSQLYSQVKAIDGVDSALVTKFQRFGKSADNELGQGFVRMGRLEIVRLDNDRSAPENGVLRLNMLGGK